MKLLKKLDFRNDYGRELFATAKRFRVTTITIILYSLILVVTSLFVTIVSKTVLDSVINKDMKTFFTYFSIYVVLQVFTLTLSSFISYYRAKCETRIRNELQSSFISSVFSKEWTDISKYHSGDLLTRMTKDINSIVSFTCKTLPALITLCVQLILAFSIVIQYDVILGLYGVVSAPIVAVAAYYFGKKITPMQREINTVESQYRGFLNENIQNNMIIKIFQNEKVKFDETEEIQQKKYNLVIQKSKTIISANFVIRLGYTVTSIIAFGWGAYRISQGILTFGTYTAIMQLLSKIQSPIESLTKLLPQYISSMTAMERCSEFSLHNICKLSQRHLKNEKIDININNISFGYTDNNLVINNFSYQIKSGDKIAIIGESGVGKTTILKLLMGLLKPNLGSIDIIESNQELSNNLSYYTYVPQGNTLFSGSIKYNLLLANPNATDSELQKSIKIAQADRFINSLEKGLESNIGEKGLGLSEGQLQRICIARALLKESSTLLLDEATSALDKLTEEKILKSIFEEYPDKTVIAITHRPSILKYVDKTIDLESIYDQNTIYKSKTN